MWFAQLGVGNVCFAITRFSEPPEGPQFVAIPGFDMSYLGRKYIDGQWQ